jgi:hypothetical protein
MAKIHEIFSLEITPDRYLDLCSLEELKHIKNIVEVKIQQYEERKKLEFDKIKKLRACL